MNSTESLPFEETALSNTREMPKRVITETGQIETISTTKSVATRKGNLLIEFIM